MFNNSTTSSSDVLSVAFESLFPSLSIITRLLSSYLQIDDSSCSIYLVLFAISSAFVGYILPRFLNHAQRVLICFTASVEIPFHDRLHGQFIKWTTKYSSLSHSRRSIARAKDTFTFCWQNEDDLDDDEESSTEQCHVDENPQAYWLHLKSQEDTRPIRYTPSRNKYHLFLYKGCIVALYRATYEKGNTIFLPDSDMIRIYTFFWNRILLLNLLKEVQKVSLQSKKLKVAIYRGFKRKESTGWFQVMVKPRRSFSTLALDPYIKANMLADIEDFLSPQTRDWYQSRGIPYRRGYLLYGPPGTGKSSMSFALAGHVWLDIYTISLNSKNLDEDALVTLLQSLPKRCMVLLEDVDNAGINQKHTRQVKDPNEGPSEEEELGSTGISLSALLNCLDGVGAQEGRILIMTTNHLEKLDDALIRPGRVDKKYHFGSADTTSTKQLFQIFYAGTVEEDVRDSLTSPASPTSPESENIDHSTSIPSLSCRFADIVFPAHKTAAEINNYLMSFKDDPMAAVLEASSWLKVENTVAKSSL